MLYGPSGECLYVGSSVNMKRRVASHKHRSLAARVDFHPCAEEDLRDKEEEMFLALRPSLNKTRVISRPNQPSVFWMEREPTLEECGCYWQWRIGSISIAFRTKEEALGASSSVKAMLTDRTMALMESSLRSMNGDHARFRPVKSGVQADKRGLRRQA